MTSELCSATRTVWIIALQKLKLPMLENITSEQLSYNNLATNKLWQSARQAARLQV